MKIRNNVKLFIAFILILLAVCIFNCNTVNAVETSEILDKIPNEMQLNISEIEYEKADNIILENVKKILSDNGITNAEIYVEASPLWLTKEQFYKASININGVEKTINLVYNNHSNYNSTDEQAVKNIKLASSPEYYTYNFDSNINIADTLLTDISTYYQNKINDKSIKIVATTGSAGGHLLDFGMNIILGIFKNNVLYDIRNVTTVPTICQMTIPENVVDTEYALPLIKKYWKEYCDEAGEKYNDNITLSKGLNNGLKIENAYTVKQGNEVIGQIILKKQVSSVSKKDTATNIKLETNTDVVPSNTILVANELKEEKILNTVTESLKEVSTKFVTYDITLQANGSKIQPNGKVKLSIPIPSGYDKTKLAVYRIEDDGTKIKYDTKLNGNVIEFETDHFSTYVLAEEKEGTKTDTETPSTTTQTKPEHKLDDTPKTGVESILTIAFSLVAVISLAGIIILKRK